MGITTYLFHKSSNLERQRYDMFFLDMGENIHFHYRDMRIELSVEEFKELAELFVGYSREVLREIEAGYRDGVLANTNEENSLRTFWDREKKLVAPVKYNERKLAIEETRDGYHLHIRNYKILLQKESFFQLVRAIAPIQPLLDSGSLVRDPVRLLAANELETRLLSRLQTTSREEIVIEVGGTHRNKAGQVLSALGYLRNEAAGHSVTYTRDNSIIRLVSPGFSPTGQVPGEVVRSEPNLPEFLAGKGCELDKADLNQLKLKVLSLLKMAQRGQVPPFPLSAILVNEKTLNPAIDFFQGEGGDYQEQVAGLQDILTRSKLFFVKPEKDIFPPEHQERLQDQFFNWVMKHIAAKAFVRKIFILGSSASGRAGRYRVPFVHFDWAKLNSDFDIFVELDPEYEGDLPEEWEKKFYWPRNGSDYYHFGELGEGMASEYARQYPGIRFYEHLVEGYLYRHGRGDQARRDQWFAEIKAQCIFVRDRIADWLRDHYPLVVDDTERIKVASFNRVYRVTSPTGPYVLKIYDSRYLDKAGQEKIAYEIGLLDYLGGTGLEVALPVRNARQRYISFDGGDRAVLFSMVPGRYVDTPGDSESRQAGNLLARLHIAARQYRTPYAWRYGNRQPLFYWLDAWQQYHNQGEVIGTDIELSADRCKKRLRDLDCFLTHCHGDLSKINYLFDGTKCWLIDFQNIGYGPALIDLANGMVEFAATTEGLREEIMFAFRDGYEQIRPLETEEQSYLNDLLVIQAAVRQAKLLRLHYGGFGYELQEARILGLRSGLQRLLQRANTPATAP